MIVSILEIILEPISSRIEWLSKKVASLFFGEVIFKQTTIFQEVVISLLSVIYISIILGFIILIIDYVW